MHKRQRTGAITGLLLAALAVGACSSAGASTAPTVPSAEPSAMVEPSDAMVEPSDAMVEPSDAMMDDHPFGPGCAAVPATGAGSFDGMASDPVATAASNNPILSTLVTAVTAADLGDTLNSSQDITVFAPTDDAFAATDKATLDAALADPTGLLTTVLTYHVVPGRLTPEMLAGAHVTLQGADLMVEGSGEDFTVNGAAIICGNVQTANATVYIIDGVLLPPAS